VFAVGTPVKNERELDRPRAQAQVALAAGKRVPQENRPPD
jgi:hypothetical protein